MTHTDEGQTKTFVVKRPGGLDLWPLKQLEAPAARAKLLCRTTRPHLKVPTFALVLNSQFNRIFVFPLS